MKANSLIENPTGSTRRPFLWLLLALACAVPRMHAGDLPPVPTVFIIIMENNNWSGIKGNPSAPFINQTLLPMSSYCDQYYNPPGLHPSGPNYIWLEAGTNLGITSNAEPAILHRNTSNHLVAQLRAAGISWKTYQEDIDGLTVPLTSTNGYLVRHNPFVYFDDVTGTNNPNFAYGIAHIRPFTELAADLTNHTVARYNFITPNLCNDMHDDCAPLFNGIKQGDNWLKTLIPKITNSLAYQQGGAIFVTWDEGLGSDGPIGMILLSKLARGGGYHNSIHYTHSSTVRTMQEIFGVGPLLADAANAINFSDLFCRYQLSISVERPTGMVHLNVSGVVPGRTNIVQVCTNLTTWSPIGTNVVSSNSFSRTHSPVAGASRVFYRVIELH